MKYTKNITMSLFLISAVGLSGAISKSAAAVDYYVIVNTENNFNGSDEDVKSLLRRVYLKTTRNWPGGTIAVPFARKQSDTAHAALLNNILMMTDAEHSDHWARLKQTTGDTPPRAVGSDSILLRLIKREPGAVGVIESSGDAPKGVKVLLKLSLPLS